MKFNNLLEPILSTNALLFEILEHITLVGLLVIFMIKYVTEPLQREVALRTKTEGLMEISEAKNKSIIEALPDTVVMVAADGTVLDCKLKMGNVINFEVGKNVCDPLPPDTVLDFLKHMNVALQDNKQQQIDLMFPKGDEVYYQVFNFVRTSENEILIFVRDITKRKAYEEKLEHLSTHDVLTGLYNRTFYEAELERLTTSRRYPVGIVIIDLDGLKITNDTYGHAAGDKMICKAANILKCAFRAEDLVARTGGDEFTVLLPETNAGGLQAATGRITQCLDEANSMDDGFRVKFSVGTEIAETKEKLLGAVKIADMRMYQNKAARKTSSEVNA